MLIQREADLAAIQQILKVFPVAALLGARQCGKTTLARQFSFDHYFDLENPRDLARFDNPQLTLEGLKGLIVIDEIQRSPELFPLIRYLVDNRPEQRYLILGSASQNLIRQSSESLAGRIGFHNLSGLSLEDVGAEHLEKLWFRGGFPRSFLAATDSDSRLWRENYITTFLERDIPELGIRIPARTLRRFWMMLSHYHGQILNYAELGRSFGISDMTIRKYVDILEGTFMIRVLPPWTPNMKKRLVKRPKIYLRDSGIFHSLQTIETRDQLLSHPKLGASWEGFALECLLTSLSLGNNSNAFFFWRTHDGAEVDLFWQRAGKNLGIEFKYMDAPKRTRSMQSAIHDLQLDRLWVIYPGNEKYELDDKISVRPLPSMADGEVSKT